MSSRHGRWPPWVAVLLVVLLGAVVYGLPTAPEFVLGLVVILGVSVLMVLFFVIAAGYASVGLADKRQALGLPEGSVRALIALFLLVTFVIAGLYLFQRVGLEYPKDASKAATEPVVTEEGKRLAGQLITLFGTLVGTISGFYFGTSALKSAKGVAGLATPLIRGITPDHGAHGVEVSVVITGKNFRNPQSVRLVKGKDEILATGVVSKNTEIKCKVKLDPPAGTKWDLIVENEDGEEDTLSSAFSIA